MCEISIHCTRSVLQMPAATMRIDRQCMYNILVSSSMVGMVLGLNPTSILKSDLTALRTRLLAIATTHTGAWELCVDDEHIRPRQVPVLEEHGSVIRLLWNSCSRQELRRKPTAYTDICRKGSGTLGLETTP